MSSTSDTNEKILLNVQKLIEAVKHDDMQRLFKINKVVYTKTLSNRFKDFHISYPALFTTIIDDPFNFPMNRLLEMLQLKSKVEKDKISYQEASEKIGRDYYDEFVDHLVNKLDKNNHL